MVLLLNLVPMQGAFADDASGEKSPIHDLMEAMKDPYRNLSRAMRSPAENYDSIIKDLRFLQIKTLESKGFEVPMRPGAKLSAGEYQKSYEMELNRVVIALAGCELAMIEGNYELAAEKFSEVKSLRKSGHRVFKP